MGRLHFAKAIKQYREGLNISQNQLVGMLYKLSYTIDTSTLSRYESSERVPPASFIAYFSKALELTPKDKEYLLSMYIEDYRMEALEDFAKAETSLRN